MKTTQDMKPKVNIVDTRESNTDVNIQNNSVITILSVGEYNFTDRRNIGSKANNSTAADIMANTCGTDGSRETSKTEANIAALSDIGAEYRLDNPLT